MKDTSLTVITSNPSAASLASLESQYTRDIAAIALLYVARCHASWDQRVQLETHPFCSGYTRPITEGLLAAFQTYRDAQIGDPEIIFFAICILAEQEADNVIADHLEDYRNLDQHMLLGRWDDAVAGFLRLVGEDNLMSLFEQDPKTWDRRRAEGKARLFALPEVKAATEALSDALRAVRKGAPIEVDPTGSCNSGRANHPTTTMSM